MKRFRLALPLWSLAAVSAFGCSGDKAPARGQIMLALHTDMALPKDISRVKLQVLTAGPKDSGAVKFDRTFTVGANGEAKIPATFAIVAPEGQSPTVEVRLIGLGGSKARTFSKVITTVPKDRIATLNMPIQWLCDDSVQEIGGESYESNCPPVGGVETSCVAGICQDVNFPEAKLPTFSAPEVYGGGSDAADPSGKCFDTVSCFDPGFDVTPNSDCRVTIKAPAHRPLNFAIVPKKANEGICGTNGHCYVPLDQNENFGWTELSGPITGGGDGGAGGESGLGAGGAGGDSSQPDFGAGSVERTIQLPPGVCERQKRGLVDRIRATGACDLKTEGIPVCGDWYSVAAAHVTPETSTMTGGGMMTGGCPEFKPGSSVGTVSDNPLLDGTVQAAADVKALSDELAREVFEACTGIIRDLGKTPPTSAVTPSAALITNACTQAQTELGAAGGTTAGAGWSVLVTPSKCGVSVDDQVTCESACSKAACPVGGPEPDQRCESLGGSCNGMCTGECAGSRDLSVECSGTCDGICTGSCQGTCVLTDGSPAGANCGGWCTGNCVGSCAGTCTPSSDNCQGTCWRGTGECFGQLTDLVCETPLSPEACLGDCGALCGAHAALGQTCQAPNAEVFGDAPPLVRTALDAHYWKLFDVIYRSSGITQSIPLISQVSASLARNNSLLSDMHAAACFTTAQNALGAAAESLSATITAASQTATSITTGPTAGVCQTSDSESACTRCVKSNCCQEFAACSADAGCAGGPDAPGEFQCVSGCYQSGEGNASVCEQGSACKPSATAMFSPSTMGLLACAHDNCQTNCFTQVCSASQLLCNGACANVQSDPLNCGGCGRACATGQSCSAGTCVCPTGTTLCTGQCVDTNSNRSNCGRCGGLCAGSQTCVDGTCVGGSGAGGAGGGGGASSGGVPNTAGSAGFASGGLPGGGAGGLGGGSSASAGAAGAGTPPCPQTTPQAGSGCSATGQMCTYGVTVCTCSLDGWSCVSP